MLYVPILKWKQGEKDALLNLSEETKSEIIPLLELTPDTIEKGDGLRVSKFWSGLFYFDTSFEIDISDEEFVNIINESDLVENVIPVIKFEDSIEKVKSLCKLSKQGFALRLSINDCMEDGFTAALEIVFQIINRRETDLILDVKDVDSSKINEQAFLIAGAFGNIPELNLFRNIILSTNSFPSTLKNCATDTLTVLERTEKTLYNRVVKSLPNYKICYSDYAINHWSYFDFIPGIKPSFNIRYTTTDYYLVYKGKTVQKGGLNIEFVKAACECIVDHPLYSGSGFSWGDNEIFLKANDSSVKPGNLTTWRTIGTNHHISLVVNQLSNQHGSLVSL